jgi:hypothetical protein
LAWQTLNYKQPSGARPTQRQNTNARPAQSRNRCMPFFDTSMKEQNVHNFFSKKTTVDELAEVLK